MDLSPQKKSSLRQNLMKGTLPFSYHNLKKILKAQIKKDLKKQLNKNKIISCKLY